MAAVALAQWGGITASQSPGRPGGPLSGQSQAVPGAQVTWPRLSPALTPRKGLNFPGLWVGALPLKLPWQGPQQEG